MDLKRGKKIGAYFGIIGAIIGLILFAFFFELGLQDISTHSLASITVILPGIGFATWFGSRAGQQIQQSEISPFVTQFFSAIFTLISTILSHAILYSIFSGGIKYLSIIPFAIVGAFIVGIIPVILLAFLFGYLIRIILKPKT